MSDQQKKGHINPYLDGWYEIMKSNYPLSTITWLAGGSLENESMVVHHLRLLQDELLKSNPKIFNKIFTNCKDIDGWQWSYVIENSLKGRPSHIFERALRCVTAMLLEDGFSSDLYISNGLVPAWGLYGNGLAYFNLPAPPIICVMPKAPESYWAYTTDKVAPHILSYMCRHHNFWLFTLDNQSEYDLMLDMCAKAGHPRYPRIRKVNTYSWTPKPFPTEKQDIVVWSGRLGAMKKPKLGADIFSLNPQVAKEVFIPRRKTGRNDIPFDNLSNTTIHFGEPPHIYREMTKRAKAILVTSETEGYGVGFIELWGNGVLPVIYRKNWNRDLLPKDWPLFFDSAGEGAELIDEAIKNYHIYAPILWEWMKFRFFKPFNFSSLVETVWRTNMILEGDSIRLVQQRGERRVL